MSEIHKQIANALQGMSPDAIVAYLDDLKRDATARTELARKESEADISSLSDDQLASELDGYDPRRSDRMRFKKVNKEITRRQNAAVTEANLLTMSRADFEANELKRSQLVDEISTLSPTRDIARLREASAELKSIPAPADRIIEPPVKADG